VKKETDSRRQGKTKPRDFCEPGAPAAERYKVLPKRSNKQN